MRLPFWGLQLARDNHTGRMHEGTNRDNNQTAEWSIDGTIEVIQHRYKNMSFKNDEDSWVKHSINMPLVSQCITHSNNEYSRRNDVESYNGWEEGNPDVQTDRAHQKTASKEPRRLEEIKLISEMLLLSKMFVETPGRIFDMKSMWDVLPNLTTVLGPMTGDHSPAEELTEETQLSQLTEELSDAGVTTNNGPLNTAMFSVEGERLGVDNIAAMVDGLNDELETLDKGEDTNENRTDETILGGAGTVNFGNENEADMGTTGNTVDCDEVVQVMVGGRQIKNVRKATVNIKAANDTFESGKRLLQNENLVRTRLKKRQREKRERVALQDNLYSFLTEFGGEVPALVAKLEAAKATEESPHAQESEHHLLARSVRQM